MLSDLAAPGAVEDCDCLLEAAAALSFDGRGFLASSALKPGGGPPGEVVECLSVEMALRGMRRTRAGKSDAKRDVRMWRPSAVGWRPRPGRAKARPLAKGLIMTARWAALEEVAMISVVDLEVVGQLCRVSL